MLEFVDAHGVYWVRHEGHLEATHIPRRPTLWYRLTHRNE
jgi:hypothetical protein